MWMFIAMTFSKDDGAIAGQTVDLRPALSQFVGVINQWSEKDQYRGQFRLRLRRIRALELPEYALEPETSARKRRLNEEGVGAMGTNATKRVRTAKDNDVS